MKRSELVTRVRAITRDLLGNTFQENHIHDFLNEAIDRVKQVIPEFKSMQYLASNDSTPTHIPEAYHSLLAAYASASLYFQDDRHHQAGTKMNEFETKLGELKESFLLGDVDVTDQNGVAIYPDYGDEAVRNVYFDRRDKNVDVDLGVEGVLF